MVTRVLTVNLRISSHDPQTLTNVKMCKMWETTVEASSSGLFTCQQPGLQDFSSRVERQRVGEQGFGQQTQIDQRSKVKGQVICDDFTSLWTPGQHGLMKEKQPTESDHQSKVFRFLPSSFCSLSALISLKVETPSHSCLSFILNDFLFKTILEFGDCHLIKYPLKSLFWDKCIYIYWII